jgi:hypothetical protein
MTLYLTFMAYDGFVEQELPTIPEHLSSPPGFSGVRVTRSLVLYVCFVDHCPLSVDHCIICPTIYGFWLPLWYRQTFLVIKHSVNELFVISYERGNEVYCDYNQQYTSIVIWDRYSVTVNQVMMATVKIFKTIYLISSFITYHKILMRVTRRVSLVEQELLIRSDRVRFLVVTQLVLFCVVFCRSLSFVRWPLWNTYQQRDIYKYIFTQYITFLLVP